MQVYRRWTEGLFLRATVSAKGRWCVAGVLCDLVMVKNLLWRSSGSFGAVNTLWDGSLKSVV